MKICILDYGSGNVASVFNMLKFIEFAPEISNEKKKIRDASHVILPGVGSYKSGMEKIKRKLPIDCLENEILKKGKPFLGICLGMQVLSTVGYEFGKYQGLNWVEGEVKKLDVKKSILPHVGWNEVKAKSKNNILFNNIDTDENFYFVHSYYFNSFNKKNILATSIYEETFASAIRKDNVFGVQFHPEKSQKSGMKLLKNFLKI